MDGGEDGDDAGSASNSNVDDNGVGWHQVVSSRKRHNAESPLLHQRKLIVVKYIERLFYWKRQNVATLSTSLLLWKTRNKPLHQVISEVYEEMFQSKESFRAIELVFFSALFVQDQVAIKNILATQYENFADRGIYVNENDPLLNHMARLPYEKWQLLRRKFGPAFAPNMTKTMYPLVTKCCEQFVEVLKQSVETSHYVTNVHDLCSRFAIDVIGSIAFGVECNSFKDPQAMFRTLGEKASREHFQSIFQFKTKYLDILKLFNVKYHSKETTDFFTNLVKETMKQREEHAIQRGDFMDILIELKNDPNGWAAYPLTLERLVAQAFLFFGAGYNSTAAALSEALYEMAKNQDIQNKARQEVFEVLRQSGSSDISYECTKEMKYIKQVIVETLRRYTLVYMMPRYCRQSCTVATSNGSLNIDADTFIIIPVHAIHNNAEYYPEPHVFRPERFEASARANRPVCSFMGFGGGPKTCIAENFSYAKVIACLAHLLINFRFSTCEETPKELIFDREIFRLSIDEIYLKVEKLTHKPEYYTKCE
uniref:Cytochrome P450 n=1 Tax=Stomoxys calcitrans TaxID=35570 RepID=A0A1I8PR31_STOCA